MSYTERTQVLLSPEQRKRVSALARETRKSVGAVIRDAIDAYVPPRVSRERRQAAMERLFALDLPAQDWEDVKREIEDSYVEPWEEAR